MYAVCIQYAVYKTDLSVKLCFSIQRTLQYESRANKFNRELEKESNEIVKIVGIVFRNLSKGFDCIPHDLLLVKMESSRTFLLFYVHSSSVENNL